MPTRYGISPWVHQFPDSRRPAYPRLREDHVVDAVIVGGGLTGCATAYACAAAGVKVLLVEGHRIGQGGAGRSAGLVLPEPGPAFRDIAQAHGLRTARRAFEAWRQGAIDAAAVLRRLRIRCGLETLSTVTVAAREHEKLLRREFEAREEADLGVTWVQGRALKTATSLEVPSGIRMRDACAVDPYRACLGMAAAAKGRGAIIFEQSPARKVSFGRKGVEVVTERGTIRAATVVVTTGTATPEFKPLRRHFKRRETYLVLTEPVPAVIRKQMWARDVTFRDVGSVGNGSPGSGSAGNGSAGNNVPRRRVRWTADDRMLVSGGDQDEPQPKHRDAVLVQRTGQLMYDMLTMYPVISGLRPEYGWHLTYGETADGLMYIGPHRNYPHHLFALGGATDSIAGAFLAARLVTKALKGASEKGDEVFGFTR